MDKTFLKLLFLYILEKKKDDYIDIDVTESLKTFFVEIQALQNVFSISHQISLIDLGNAMKVCEKCGYFQPEIICSKKEEVLRKDGFSETCIQIILNYSTNLQEKELKKTFALTGASGTLNDPKVFSQKLPQLRSWSLLKNDILFGISVLGLSDSLAGIERIQHTVFTPFLFPHEMCSILACLQGQDLIICTFVVSVQCGLSLYQWYRGDITLKQLKKEVICSFTTTFCAMLGVIAFASLGSFIGSLIPGIGTILGGFIGGVIGGILTAMHCRKAIRNNTEEEWPDDIVEETNNKRQLIQDSCDILKCSPDISDADLKQKYYDAMNWDLGNSPQAAKKYLQVIAAYEAIKTYRHTITEAYEKLGLEQPTTVKILEEMWEKNKEKKFDQNGITKERYEQYYLILKQHVNERHTPKGLIRKFFAPNPVTDI